MPKAKALTREITRKQARSYEQSRPNARGVTHLVELNGPGAYDRRYQETKEFLSNSETSMYTAKQQRAMKKMSPARKAAFRKMLDRAPSIDKVRRARRSKSKRKAAPKRRRRATANKAAPKRRRRSPARTKAAAKKARGKALSRARRTPAAKKAAARRPRKEHFVRSQLAKGRSKKQAEAAWKLAHGRHTKRGGRQTRKYADKYKALRARYGPKSRWTYKYKTKKGKVRDIPDHALLGYPSAAAMRRGWTKGSEAERGRIAEKTRKLAQRRERDSARTGRRIRRGLGVFSPNAGDEILSFQEWKEMRPNAKRKGWTKAKRRAAGKKAARTRKRRARTGKRTGKRTAKRKTTKRKSPKRVAAGKKAARTRKRRASSKSGSRTKRRTPKRRTKRRGKKRVSVATRRKISAALKRYHKTCRGGKRKTTRRRKSSKRRTARRNQGSYAANRRRYRANVGGPEYMTELKNALKLGVLVTVGYMAHRALTKVLSDQVLGKIDMFATGNMAKWRGLISSVVTAMIGVPLTVRIAPKQAVPVAAGIAASLIQGAIVEALSQAGQAGAAAYISNYPNAEGSMYGSGIGSYYTFQPHEVYSGMGSYYELPAMQGMGQSPMLTQAAAGYGQMTDAQLRQAAAGYGQSPMLTQAAAGMGQAQLTQAAAGTGEYIAYGVSGIGEYDEVPTSHRPMNVDEGIYPNLHSAEQALSVAEAAAGVGSADIPLQSTVDPTIIADPISDLPGGSRAGVFQGGDGVFG